MTVMDVSENMMEKGSIEIPLMPEEELRIIEDLMDKAEATNPKEGDLYYVISARWFANWHKYTEGAVSCYCMDDNSLETCPSMISNGVERPGPIDNTNIIVMDDDYPQVISNLEEDRDYMLLHHKVWQELYGWYKGGPALPRKMISLGDNNQLIVEVFPYCLNLIDSRDESETIIRLSKKASLHELYGRVSALKSLDLEKVRLWDYFDKSPVLLISSEKTLVECMLVMNHDILVEVQVNGTWPSMNNMDSTGNELALVPAVPTELSLTTAEGPTLSSTYSRGDSSDNFGGSGFACISGDSDDSFENLNTVVKGVKGLSGLVNLGNTCFMNSALQCLFHTPQLVDYFLKDFTDEINRDNLLGMNGELAIAFGNLLRKLWLRDCRPLAPRGFKSKLGRFAPQFSGYNQHDSQELLAFLLDGLHEDLNRVKQKPYIEAKDFDDQPESEIAEELWRYHKARNDSIIVDTCQGQYKSTVVCPVCDKISITFDPFMYLSLPLPSRETREITVTVFYGDGSRLPMPYTVTVLKQGCCTDLQKALGDACCLSDDEYILLADVYGHKIFRYYEIPTESLASIKESDCIVAYVLPKSESDLIRLEICHRHLQQSTFLDNLVRERRLCLTPLITFLENPQSGADIDDAVSIILSPFRRTPSCTSTTINLAEEPGPFLKEPNTTNEECTISAGQDIPSVDGLESEEMESSEMTFQICITSDHGLNCVPIQKDMCIRPGRMLKVMLDWFEEEIELYDVSCLTEIPKVYNNDFKIKMKEESISLFSCLDAFMKEEPLGHDDMWYCPHCKEHRQATKKLDLWRLPDIVVFHLKRFSYGRWSKDKLEDFVDFPVHNLDLSKYVKCKDASEKSHIYDLYAISNHYGGLGGGHYTAYSKCEDGRWYHFDDSLVSSVEESEIQSSDAYVLFYKRVDIVDIDVGVDVDNRVDIDMDVEANHPNVDVGESSQGGQDDV